MKKITCLFFLIITIIQSSYSKKYDIQAQTNSLNDYLDKQESYQTQKDDRIAFIKGTLRNQRLSLEEKYSITNILYEEYSTYKYDSMYVYADKLLTLAKRLDNKNFIVKANLTIVNSFLWGGLFKDAVEYFNQIDTINIDIQTKAEYWSCYFDLTFESGLYARYNSVLFPIYEQKMIDILDQLERLAPENTNLLIDKKIKLAFHNGENAKAIEYSLQLKDKIQPKDSTSIFYSELLGNIGYNYIDLGDTIRGMQYMTESAILALKQGSRKYPALRRIAEATYAMGELEDAYKYIQLSMSNAKFFGSRYRIYEASKILPKVDSDLNNMIHKQKVEITNLLIVVTISAILLFFTILMYIKRNRKLKLMKQKLNDQNIQLIENNLKIRHIIQELSEANKIKEAGIGQLFNSNIEIYNKLDVLQKGIIRKIKARQLDDLEYFVNNSDVFVKRNKIVENFDTMFLQVFPDFIQSFNTLLDPKHHIHVSNKEKLTPELRIFALIRIGFSKNETIAKFLNYSVSTVKNYKTKIKNLSIVPNDEFEEYIKKC